MRMQMVPPPRPPAAEEQHISARQNTSLSFKIKGSCCAALAVLGMLCCVGCAGHAALQADVYESNKSDDREA